MNAKPYVLACKKSFHAYALIACIDIVDWCDQFVYRLYASYSITYTNGMFAFAPPADLIPLYGAEV
jgi:hypothetical protein